MNLKTVILVDLVYPTPRLERAGSLLSQRFNEKTVPQSR